MTPPLRVIIAANRPLLCEILRTALSHAAMEVIAEARSAAELVSQCEQLVPDVLVTASMFDDAPLLDALADVLTRGTRVLVVCESMSSEIVSSLLMAGATGYLSVDDAGLEQVADATRAVAAGNAALHPAAARAVLKQWRDLQSGHGGDASVPQPPRAQLSSREREVLSAIAAGLTNRGIGQRLGVSVKTVEAHKSRIFAKLGAKNQAHAVSLAADHRLLWPTPRDRA